MSRPVNGSGVDWRYDRGGLGAALRALHEASRRAPTEADAPSPSTFPMTRAARAALELRRAALEQLGEPRTDNGNRKP